MAPDTFIGFVAGLVLSVCSVLVAFLFATGAIQSDLELALVLALVSWLSICGGLALGRYRRGRRVAPGAMHAIERLIEELGGAEETTSSASSGPA